LKKFIFATDLHYGYERRGGHKIALHDSKALSILLQFAADFKPDTVILGGDILDCSAISHHNKGKPGAVEGLRLLGDAQECQAAIIDPISALAKETVYIEGNHERWLRDLINEIPGLEGIVSLEALLNLKNWTVVPQGGVFNMGKLTFMHGDGLSGGEHIAKSAVITYERSVRFGHVHTAQMYTKNSPLDQKHAKTGVAVPCLCKKGPGYGRGKPNRWSQGFLFGYMWDGGLFNDYIVIVTDGKAAINGKMYKA
jgi:metallophosphoesterase superfamily enzyme